MGVAAAGRRLTVAQLLPALDAGGVERSTLEVAQALVEAGHRALVVSAGGRLLPALRALGAEHLDRDIGRKSPLSLRHVPALRRLFAGERVDIVHVRSRLPAWLAHLALRRMPAPPVLVATVHGLNSPGRYSKVLTRGERVICVSETVRAHLLRHYPDLDPDRLRVIPRGIRPEDYPRGWQPAPEWRQRFAAELPALRGGRLLLLPARGTRLKGHAEAIELLAALRAEGLDVRLLMAGAVQAGRERYLGQLRARAQALGVAGYLALTPPRADLRDLYAAADLVLQLSAKPEAFGRTVLEALSIGRPVLGWAHGGVGELLAELYPNGAVAPGAMAQLAARARALLADPAPLPATIPYTLASMQRQTLELYAQLCSG